MKIKKFNEGVVDLSQLHLKDLKVGGIENERYNLYFSDYPFKSLSIKLKKKDNKELFIFSCIEGSNKRWYCGMFKTSFYQSNVYEKDFTESDTLDKVIKYVDETFEHLRDTLNDNFPDSGRC